MSEFLTFFSSLWDFINCIVRQKVRMLSCSCLLCPLWFDSDGVTSYSPCHWLCYISWLSIPLIIVSLVALSLCLCLRLSTGRSGRILFGPLAEPWQDNTGFESCWGRRKHLAYKRITPCQLRHSIDFRCLRRSQYKSIMNRFYVIDQFSMSMCKPCCFALEVASPEWRCVFDCTWHSSAASEYQSGNTTLCHASLLKVTQQRFLESVYNVQGKSN